MNKFTDTEVAGLIWNTIYPDRKRFSQIGKTAQEEWTMFAQTARTILDLENMEPNLFAELKDSIKL